jgi:hypothetical protein
VCAEGFAVIKTARSPSAAAATQLSINHGNVAVTAAASNRFATVNEDSTVTIPTR